MKAWLIPIATLQAADLLLAGSVGISWEANPVMELIWAKFGFFSLIIIKAGAVAIFYPAILICTHQDNPYRKWFTRAVRVALIGWTLALLTVVVWNLLQIR